MVQRGHELTPFWPFLSTLLHEPWFPPSECKRNFFFNSPKVFLCGTGIYTQTNNNYFEGKFLQEIWHMCNNLTYFIFVFPGMSLNNLWELTVDTQRMHRNYGSWSSVLPQQKRSFVSKAQSARQEYTWMSLTSSSYPTKPSKSSCRSKFRKAKHSFFRKGRVSKFMQSQILETTLVKIWML